MHSSNKTGKVNEAACLTAVSCTFIYRWANLICVIRTETAFHKCLKTLHAVTFFLHKQIIVPSGEFIEAHQTCDQTCDFLHIMIPALVKDCCFVDIQYCRVRLPCAAGFFNFRPTTLVDFVTGALVFCYRKQWQSSFRVFSSTTCRR